MNPSAFDNRKIFSIALLLKAVPFLFFLFQLPKKLGVWKVYGFIIPTKSISYAPKRRVE